MRLTSKQDDRLKPVLLNQAPSGSLYVPFTPAYSWNHNLYPLDRGAAPPVLASHNDGLVAARKRRRKIFECAVTSNIRDRLSVDDKRRAGFRAPADLHHVTMQLGTSDFQEHLLAFALCRECKL